MFKKILKFEIFFGKKNESKKDIKIRRIVLFIITIVIVISGLLWGFYNIFNNIFNNLKTETDTYERIKIFVGLFIGLHFVSGVICLISPLIFWLPFIFTNILILLILVEIIYMYFMSKYTSIGYGGQIVYMNVIPAIILFIYGNKKISMLIFWGLIYVITIITGIFRDIFWTDYELFIDKVKTERITYVLSNYCGNFLFYIVILLLIIYKNYIEEGNLKMFINIYNDLSNFKIQNEALRKISEKKEVDCTYYELVIKRIVHMVKSIILYSPKEMKFLLKGEKDSIESDSDSEKSIKTNKTTIKNFDWRGEIGSFVIFKLKNSNEIAKRINLILAIIESANNENENYGIINIKLCQIIVHFNTFKRCISHESKVLDLLSSIYKNKKEDAKTFLNLFDVVVILDVAIMFGLLGTKNEKHTDIYFDDSRITEISKIKQYDPKKGMSIPVCILDEKMKNTLSYSYELETLGKNMYLYHKKLDIKQNDEWNYTLQNVLN